MAASQPGSSASLSLLLGARIVPEQAPTSSSSELPTATLAAGLWYPVCLCADRCMHTGGGQRVEFPTYNFITWLLHQRPCLRPPPHPHELIRSWGERRGQR